jgi:hypothetical protein
MGETLRKSASMISGKTAQPRGTPPLAPHHEVVDHSGDGDKIKDALAAHSPNQVLDERRHCSAACKAHASFGSFPECLQVLQECLAWEITVRRRKMARLCKPLFPKRLAYETHLEARLHSVLWKRLAPPRSGWMGIH